jgi:hypothetical protein
MDAAIWVSLAIVVAVPIVAVIDLYLCGRNDD